MKNDLQHPVITRLRAFGYEYDEPELYCCSICGRELTWEDADMLGNYPVECFECREGEEGG